MKYLKILGLAAVVAAALMAFAGTASATTLTSPSGTTLPKGTTITSEINTGEAILKSSFIGEIKCKKSTVSGKTSNEGSATETVSGPIETLNWTECNCTEPVVLKKGELIIHTEGSTANGNGTLTSAGSEVTTECFGLHCIWNTGSGVDLGTLAGGSPAILTASAVIPRTGGRSGAFCGETAKWTASYKVVTPKPLFVD